jgi:acetyl-CoA acyltransferase
MNVARTTMIAAGLPVETSAMTINRYCSSGLQTISIAADRIRTGAAEVIIACGLETMSMIPMGGNVVRPNPHIVDTYPDYYLNMGLTAENLARKYEITRSRLMSFRCVRTKRLRRRSRLGRFKDEIAAIG